MTEVLIVLVVAMLAVFALLALALAMHWGHKRDIGLAPFVFYGTVLAAGLSVGLSPRDLMAPEDAVPLAAGGNMIAGIVGKLATVFLILACGERIMHWIVSRNKRPVPRLLMAGFWLYFATNLVAPAMFGRIPSFSHEYLHAFLFAQAAMLFSMREVELTIDTLRNVLFAFLVAGVVLLVVKPSQVLGSGYHGLIPFLTVRYAGLASHANTLGPLIVVFLLCLLRQPFSRRWLNRLGWGVALLSLVIAQSKTSWIAFMLSAMCLGYYSYRSEIGHWFSNYKQPVMPTVMVAGMMFVVLAAVLLVMFGDLGARFDRLAATSEAASLTSFSGRDQIWNVAMEEWHRNPVFGYGLKIWDLDYKMSIRMMFATHAHSQFFQAVSSAGTVGLIGLVGYTLILTYLSIRTAHVSGGMTLALLISLYVRAISEVPLSIVGFAADFIGHLLLIVVLTGYCMQLRAQSARTVPEKDRFVAKYA